MGSRVVQRYNIIVMRLCVIAVLVDMYNGDGGQMKSRGGRALQSFRRCKVPDSCLPRSAEGDGEKFIRDRQRDYAIGTHSARRSQRFI